jgi:polysaccharide biosynthesis transport protein
MNEIVNVDLTRRMQRYDRLKKIKETYAELLGKKRETIRKLAESAGSDDRQTLVLHQRYAMEQQQDLQRELRDVQSQKRRLDVQLKSARPGGPGEGETEPEHLSEQQIDRLVEAHPAVVELAQQLEAREQQFDVHKARVAKLSRYPNADPAIRALYDDVQGLRRALQRRRREVRSEVIRQAQRRESIDEDQKGQEARRELAMLGDLEQRLNQEINSIKLGNQELTTNTLDIRKQQDELAQMDMVSTSVAREVEALSLELEAPARIRAIDEATVPHTRDEKKRYTMIAVATLGSFFGGLFGVAFLELQSRKVDTAEDVPVELGLPVVGALPMLPARTQRGLALAGRDNDKDRYWRNVLLESVDATRTLLLHAARTGSYRVLMITSAVGGEGKTSLASYLATSLARSGLRTLLIDADLRRPMMHRLFDLPPTPGLSELLRDQVELEGALAATAVEDLALLPAGHCDRETLRILSKGGIAPLFDRLKRRFDFIIVDSSPILPVADAMMIAQHADAALFSIIRDVSRKTNVKAASERLQHLGVPVLGAVVTGAHGGDQGNNYYGAGTSYSAGLPESVAVSADEELS